MKLFLLGISFLLVSPLGAQINPYQLRPKHLVPLCDSDRIELANLPPVMDQGPFGTCYAQTSLLLLEYLRCSKDSNPDKCYQDRGSVMHLSRFNNYYVEKLAEGGDTKELLKNFQEKGRKLGRERCAPYATWELLNIKLNEMGSQLPLPEGRKPGRTYDYFSTLAAQLKKGATEEEKRCWAEEIISSHVAQNANDLIAIMNQANRLSVDQLRYKILVPEKCMNDVITYLPYERDNYPTHDKSFGQMAQYVHNALKRGNPVEASICTARDRDKKCIGFHSTTLVGQRRICDRSHCQLQFRIQNSLGQSWQELHEGGWVDAEAFTRQMKDVPLGFTVISPKGQSLKPLLEYRPVSKSPVKANTPTKNIGKERCYDVSE